LQFFVVAQGLLVVSCRIPHAEEDGTAYPLAGKILQPFAVFSFSQGQAICASIAQMVLHSTAF
jgi:hypothetical protein